jgi:hypothetical protein
MSHATRVAWIAMIVILAMLGSIAGGYLLIRYQISHSQQQWCDTIKLLTGTPVPSPSDPAKNPSRVEAYRLYEDFVTLKTRFGCKESS